MAESQLLSSLLGRGAGWKVPGYARQDTRGEKTSRHYSERKRASIHLFKMAVAMERTSSMTLIAELHVGGLLRLQTLTRLAVAPWPPSWGLCRRTGRGFVFLQDRNDLLFRAPLTLPRLVLSQGQTPVRVASIERGNVTLRPNRRLDEPSKKYEVSEEPGLAEQVDKEKPRGEKRGAVDCQRGSLVENAVSTAPQLPTFRERR
jgi:hypothetical protein